MSSSDVYLFDTEPDRWAWLEVPRGDDGLLLVDLFDGSPASVRWNPVEVGVILEDDGSERPLGDVATFYPGAPALSPKSCQALARFLEPNGELLPLRSRDPRLQGWCVFNATAVVDALEEDLSVVRRISSGKIVDIRHYEFQGDRLPAAVFKIPQSARAQLFCLGEFVDEVTRAGLRGFGFKKVWSSTIQ